MNYQGSTSDGVVTSTLSGLGWLFDSFVISIYPLTLPFIAKDFHLRPVALGFVASLFLLGYTIGTIGFGILSDKMGRKGTLSISIAGYGVVTALTGFVGSVGILGLARFLTGLGGGGELPVAATFTSEMWPARKRGWGIGLMYAGYPLGYLLALAAASVMIPHWGWRGVYFVAIVPAVLILLIRQVMKESPRFQHVQKLMKEEHSNSRTKAGWRAVFGNKQNRRHLLIGVLIYIPLTYCYYALSVFLPSYMQKSLHLSYNGVLTDLTILTVAYLLWVIIVAWLSDIVGRKILGIATAVIGGVGALLMFSTTSPTVFLLIGLVAYPAYVGLTWTIGIAYVTEIFPTAVRGSGFGMSVGAGRITSILAPTISGAIASSIGLAGAFKIAAAVWILMIIGLLLGPETKGRTLEEIEASEYNRLGGSMDYVTEVETQL